MSYFSCKPIFTLILKHFSDHHTPFESPFKVEQKYALLFSKSSFPTEKSRLRGAKICFQKGVFFEIFEGG
jgi:hypothetical protein